ncbi:MAG: HEAT repeat domain-containing protein [Cyanobacteria bacterium P01_F01_bin.13]
MATQAGIGVLIGLGIGSGLTALLMQRIIRRQDNALQQSLNRLNRVEEDHAQNLNESLVKLEADYEQQLAAKIERYQDTHEEQLKELQAEYEARITALSNADTQPIAKEPGGTLPTVKTSEIIASNPAVDVTQSPPNRTFTPIPDPWAETSSKPVLVPEPAPEPVATPDVTTEPVAVPKAETTAPKSAAEPSAFMVTRFTQADSDTELAQTAVALGKAAAANRKDALRAIPQLGKLLKAQNANVRLAAVTALQEAGSIKSIPFLRQALRDTDDRIVATASAALSRFKGTKKPAPKVKITKKKRRR